MEPFMERLLAEHKQVEDRLNGLSTFLANVKSGTITRKQHELLQVQEKVMQAYNLVLAWRIKDLEEQEAGPKLVLSAPSAHSLQECFAELKFGRPAAQQHYLDERIAELNKAGDQNS